MLRPVHPVAQIRKPPSRQVVALPLQLAGFFPPGSTLAPQPFQLALDLAPGGLGLVPFLPGQAQQRIGSSRRRFRRNGGGIVSINPRVITGGSADLVLNGLLLANNPLISASTLVLEFPSEDAVRDYFGAGTLEHVAAQVYFTSYDNKFTAPKSFFVARRIAEAAPGWLRSARNSKTLGQFQAVTDGAFSIIIDGVAHKASGLDFSTATSFSDVAATLRAAIPEGADAVTYSSLTGAFTITSGTAGADSLVSYAGSPDSGTDLATFIGLREADGAVISAGSDALSVDEQMAAIRAKTENWVSFSTAWEPETKEALAWAAWANAHYGWLYVGWSTSPLLSSPDTDQDLASLVKAAGYDHTAIVYGSLEYAAFIMGVVASIAWQRVNGAITAAFKRQSGLAAWVADQREAQILESKNCNYFGNFATRNAEFLFLYPGCLSASDYGFIDAYVNSVWLNSRSHLQQERQRRRHRRQHADNLHGGRLLQRCL